MYQPNPMNTEHVKLSPALLSLTEALAKQVHETWAAGRVRDGWSYGETRDDMLKTTPCLVPYEDLPETERAYDRETAIATIRMICALGYRIEKDNS